MRSIPIIFSAAMVRALLARRKTQARRTQGLQAINACPTQYSYQGTDVDGQVKFYDTHNSVLTHIACPYGKIGDRLWVRETFVLENTWEYHGSHTAPTDGRPIQVHADPEGGEYWLIPHYQATEPEPHIVSETQDPHDDTTKWKSPIFMPRWASRITLEITDIRMELVQDICEEDARAEGLHGDERGIWGNEGILEDYEALWDSLHTKDGMHWDASPRVWVITLQRVEHKL